MTNGRVLAGIAFMVVLLQSDAGAVSSNPVKDRAKPDSDAGVQGVPPEEKPELKDLGQMAPRGGETPRASTPPGAGMQPDRKGREGRSR